MAIILSLSALAPQTALFSQSQPDNPAAKKLDGFGAAKKLDEFGDVESSYKKAVLDNFAVALQNEPDTRGFIIVYRSRRDLPGINGRLANWMKEYLIYSRGIAPQRVVTVDGGETNCLSHELWLVPPGATPTARSDAYTELIDTTSVRKFDEYYHQLLQDRDESVGEGDSLEGFASALRKEPRAQAYIIVYPQYYIERSPEYVRGRERQRRRVSLDSPQTTAKVLRSLKAEMVSKHGIAASRVKVINGGYRKWRQVELWVVPRGEHVPVATPNVFPKKAQLKR